MKRLRKEFEITMASVAFAEAGEFEMARKFLDEEESMHKEVRKPDMKKKPYGKMILMGIISIVLYAVLLLNQELINKYFTSGGIHTLLPIVTAFIFSFVHGTFTGDFWTVLGVEAAKKKKGVR